MDLPHQTFARDKVVVMAAPNGARRTRDDHPAVPLTATELAAEAERLLDAGVSVLHLHVRDEQGRHSIDPARYREAITAIRERVGRQLILQVTSEAVGRYSAAEQMAMVRELKPEAVSLALRELCPDEDSEADAAAFFGGLRDAGTWPQYIVYSAAELSRFDTLRKRGLFGEERPFCLLVLGRYSEKLEGGLDELDAMRDAVDLGAFPWAVCCFGRNENAAMLAATAEGGHVRIGFENNLYLADGTPARDNSALIEQYLNSSSGMGRRPAGADDIREAWQL